MRNPGSKQQLKDFLGCAAKQTYPNGLPPAVNWTAPQQCLDQYAALESCQFGEIGYAIIETANAKTSANFIYGTVTGGCKEPLNYYAILGQRPKALTAKACTGLAAKVSLGEHALCMTPSFFFTTLNTHAHTYFSKRSSSASSPQTTT